MRELNVSEIDFVSGGLMSMKSRYIIGGALLFCPVLGAGMLLGYFANS